MATVTISIYATSAPRDTGVTVEAWRAMSEAQRRVHIDQVIGDYLDITIRDSDGVHEDAWDD